MGNGNVGTPRKVIIDGINLDVMADANITFNASQYEIEGIPTTGDALFKYTKRITSKEGVTVAADSETVKLLKEKADSLADKTMSVEYADGAVFRGTGKVSFENWESETGKATLKLLPKRDWDQF